MNTILDPAGGRSASVYWRRRAAIFAAFAVVLLLMVKACGGDGPDLSGTVVQQEVPRVSTYTPTPSATATADPSSDPAIGDDPLNPYDPSGSPTDPCDDPELAATLIDEAGEPLCDGSGATAGSTTDPTTDPTLGPTFGPTAGPTKKPGKTSAVTAPAPAITSDSQAAGALSCAKSVLSVKLKADQRSYAGGEKPKLYLGVKNSGPVACLVDLGSRALSFTIISGNDRIWSSDDCQGKGTSDVRTLQPGQTMWARAVWSKVRSKPGCPKGQPVAKAGTYQVEGSAGGARSRNRAVFSI